MDIGEDLMMNDILQNIIGKEINQIIQVNQIMIPKNVGKEQEEAQKNNGIKIIIMNGSVISAILNRLILEILFLILRNQR